MTTEALEYRVYGLPIESKSYDMNDDGTLTIIGVASTTNKDYANEIVSPEVLESLAKQAVGINIYRDHNRHYEGGIGAVIEAWVDDNQLWIKGKILSEYAKGIKERLDIGMNFGFSISGFPKKQRVPEGLLIVDYDLKDITLTYIPMNWDTYGTVEYKSQNLIASNCLTGACYHAITNDDGETMENKDNDKIEEKIPEEPVEDKDIDDAGLSDTQLNQVKDLLNEVTAELEPRIIDNLKPELETIASDVASKTAEEITERLIAEFKATQTVQEEAADETVDEKELPVKEECKDESEVIETEEEEVKTEPGISEPENGELEEEEKDESELEEETTEDEEEEIDEKSMDEKIHDELVKQMNSKSFMSKYDQFRKEQSKKSTRKLEEKSADDEIKRDMYGRNLDYI
ncbi:hypothetical protein [Methanobrevibacter sp.]|uniref:hypothetical protein n=1 Tax=Methanobrevibacter sp. TaxID=66852 RepID=UPI0025F6BE07|nr:hypothetical protein [Methanobrevibacter sp.]MBQ2832331.1 hypothetical protein [Methanobrevibacter sp.]MBQ4163597.1 hypothetical protein [Turicibacter sp.]